MGMTLEQFGINRLSPQQRFELIGLIWDSIPDDVPFPRGLQKAPGFSPGDEWRRSVSPLLLQCTLFNPISGVDSTYPLQE